MCRSRAWDIYLAKDGSSKSFFGNHFTAFTAIKRAQIASSPELCGKNHDENQTSWTNCEYLLK